MTPRLNDNWFVRHAANVYLSELAMLGARIYYFEQGFMHQKVMLIDDNVSVIGTVNFDNRSFRLNFEVTSIVVDEAFATEMTAMLEADFAHAELINMQALETKPLWWWVAVKLARLAAPVL